MSKDKKIQDIKLAIDTAKKLWHDAVNERKRIAKESKQFKDDMKVLKAKLDFLDDSVIYKYITEEDLMDYCEDIPKDLNYGKHFEVSNVSIPKDDALPVNKKSVNDI